MTDPALWRQSPLKANLTVGAPPPSLQTIFESHLDYVWNALRRLGVPATDAEDLAHEVFLVIHRHLPDYDAERPIRPWLFGICTRVASDFRRKARHRYEIAAGEQEAPDEALAADTQIERRQTTDLVQQALAGLSIEQRAVLVMHDLEEHPMPVVARELDIPLNTGYSRLRMARQAFTEAVQRLRLRER